MVNWNIVSKKALRLFRLCRTLAQSHETLKKAALRGKNLDVYERYLTGILGWF